MSCPALREVCLKEHPPNALPMARLRPALSGTRAAEATRPRKFWSPRRRSTIAAKSAGRGAGACACACVRACVRGGGPPARKKYEAGRGARIGWVLGRAVPGRGGDTTRVRESEQTFAERSGAVPGRLPGQNTVLAGRAVPGTWPRVLSAPRTAHSVRPDDHPGSPVQRTCTCPNDV